MKMKDITVGSHYAVGRKYNQEPSTWDGRRSCSEAIVLEAGVHRKVWPAGSYRPVTSSRPDGVLVRYVGSGKEEVVPQQQVCQEWDAYVAEDNERAAAFAARKAARLSVHKDVSERLRDVQVLLGDSAKLPWWASGQVYNDGSYSTEGTMTTRELATLLEAAYAAGKAARP